MTGLWRIVFWLVPGALTVLGILVLMQLWSWVIPVHLQALFHVLQWWMTAWITIVGVWMWYMLLKLWPAWRGGSREPRRDLATEIALADLHKSGRRIPPRPGESAADNPFCDKGDPS